MNSTVAKIWYHQNEVKTNQIVLSEVKKLPSGVPTYKAVGRMFVFFFLLLWLLLTFETFQTQSPFRFLSSPIETVKSDLEKEIATDEAEVAQLEVSLSFFLFPFETFVFICRRAKKYLLRSRKLKRRKTFGRWFNSFGNNLFGTSQAFLFSKKWLQCPRWMRWKEVLSQDKRH